MTSSAAERIPQAIDLNLPAEARFVLPALTDEGAEAFTKEIIEALYKSELKNDLRPVRDVVEAWYLTVVAKRHPDHGRVVEASRRSPSRNGKTVHDLRRDVEMKTHSL